MNCDTFQGQLDAYADGALDAVQLAAFEAHRASCADCQSAMARADQLRELLQTELPRLAAATADEQVSLRESVLDQLGIFTGERAAQVAWRRILIRGIGTMLGLLILLAATLILLPSDKQSVSAAEILDRAQAAAEEHRGMGGVLHWEAEWSQGFPSADQVTRTFEIWFSFEEPGHYRLTQRDAEGRVLSDMVRNGEDRLWRFSRSSLQDGTEKVWVDEIVLSEEEMQELGSWYVPSPFLDDLERFSEVLSNVEKVADIQVAGRPAYVLRSQLFGFGEPTDGNRIDPVTSTVHLVVDAETYWVLERTERVLEPRQHEEVIAGVVQRTRRFELFSAEQVSPQVFNFMPPSGVEIHTVKGIVDYYASPAGTIGLEEASRMASFTLLMPTQLPGDLELRPYFQYACGDNPSQAMSVTTVGAQPDPVSQNPGGVVPGSNGCDDQDSGEADSFGVVFLGDAGRQVVLLEYKRAQPLEQAARAVSIGQGQGWLVSDPIDAHQFSLHLVEPRSGQTGDGRSWPGSVELHVWGLGLDEAVAMLASLQAVAAKSETED
jgi:hypothetical protein